MFNSNGFLQNIIECYLSYNKSAFDILSNKHSMSNLTMMKGPAEFIAYGPYLIIANYFNQFGYCL